MKLKIKSKKQVVIHTNNGKVAKIVRECEDPKYGFTLSLQTDEQDFGFRFGPKKARMILESLDEIKAFAQAHPYPSQK